MQVGTAALRPKGSKEDEFTEGSGKDVSPPARENNHGNCTGNLITQLPHTSTCIYSSTTHSQANDKERKYVQKEGSEKNMHTSG